MRILLLRSQLRRGMKHESINTTTQPAGIAAAPPGRFRPVVTAYTKGDMNTAINTHP